MLSTLLLLCPFISGEDAYKKIRAGATLVQLYTAFAYGGPALIPQIKVFSKKNAAEKLKTVFFCIRNWCSFFSYTLGWDFYIEHSLIWAVQRRIS